MIWITPLLIVGERKNTPEIMKLMNSSIAAGREKIEEAGIGRQIKPKTISSKRKIK